MTAAFPVVGITGHRPGSLTSDQSAWIGSELLRVLAKLRADHGSTVAICGMAVGSDIVFAEHAAALGYSVRAYVPFPGQRERWTREWMERYDAVLATPGVSVRMFGDRFDVRLLHQRNQAIVDDCDVLVAVLRSDSTGGGTFTTVCKARRDGRPIVHVDPLLRRTVLA